MALAMTALGGGAEGAPTGSSCTTGSISPTGNRLVLAWIYQAGESEGSTAQPSLTGNGITWVMMADVVFTGNAGMWPGRLTLFRGMVASPSSGVVTITWGSPTPMKVMWSIAEWSGVDTSGTNGSGAIAQQDTDYSNSDVTTLAPTLASFGSPSNAVAAGFARINNSWSFAVEGGYTLIHDLAGQTRSSLGTEWLDDEDTTPTATWEAASAAAIAVEINAAPPITRDVNDTASASESAAATATFGRSAGDTAAAADGIAGELDGSRTLSDTATVTETMSGVIEMARASSDAATATDAAAPSLIYGRDWGDVVASTDAVQRLLDLPAPVLPPVQAQVGGPGGLGFGLD